LESYQGPYLASELFRAYPTGFSVFPVGTAGSTSLVFLQDLAAVGPDLRGRKIAVSLSPTWFFNRRDMLDRAAYAGNFSRQHASELAFSEQLSFAFKQEAARRMLQDPDTVQQDPLLKFALDRLADGSQLNRVLYFAVLPLGKLQNVALRLQDHWQSLTVIWELRERSRIPARQAV